MRLIAHSMGGVLARTMQLERPKVWQRMMAHPGARLLMLGTPNARLVGADAGAVRRRHVRQHPRRRSARRFRGTTRAQLMAQFPGFIQLQAGLLDEAAGSIERERHGSGSPTTIYGVCARHSWWQQRHSSSRTDEWGVPPQSVLDRAVALRERLDAQRDRPARVHGQAALVDRPRALHAGWLRERHDGLVYLNAPDDGDGRVTRRARCCPACARGQLDCDHGRCRREGGVHGLRELLDNGIYESAGAACRDVGACAARDGAQPRMFAAGPRARV